MKKPPYFVGISGGSASGKTFLLDAIMNAFGPHEITLISQDNYYKSLEAQRREPDGDVNFDHPDSVELDRLYQDLQRIRLGETVGLWEYTFNNPNLESRWITYAPAPVVIVEGIFALLHPETNAMYDLRLFIEADEHIRLARRLMRDVKERAYSFETTLNMYRKFTAPMYRQYVEPARFSCDLIIPNNHHMEKATEIVIGHLQGVLKQC